MKVPLVPTLAGGGIVLALLVLLLFVLSGRSEQGREGVLESEFYSRELLLPQARYLVPPVEQDLLHPELRYKVDPRFPLDAEILDEAGEDLIEALRRDFLEQGERHVEQLLFD
ncbi:hypothetical protein AU468_06030 [Alkalispirochaeta sphaeroplastigenens]|uniref:Uncharacterized protein n=1 Tax=Alkalispirochaeta sphaeroplastigenens TaxID=1187066 RepID=A0A2S4JTF6_9SPIO|nr:hypothetical protein [Alkalispirochaeta sphaeroplastigenens]POR02812.1 hypothetical protein AU468_06030 [Alkalispirochaeta sphaeroplastigenens]